MYTTPSEALSEPIPRSSPEPGLPLWQIFFQFLRFGMLAWGGPIVQIAIIREELVLKQRWIKGKKFSRALAVYQMLPGPEATKMSIFMGMRKGGRLGGLMAGIGFILPGFVLTILVSALYQRLGASEFMVFFAGIQPAITALICYAMISISSHVIKRNAGYVMALFAFACILIGIHFLLVFLACGIIYSLWFKGKKWQSIAIALIVPLAYVIFHVLVVHQAGIKLGEIPVEKNALTMFWASVKAGALSFGGAYTTVPLFKDSMVNTGWLTQQQLMDGLAIISILPAPVTMLSAFLGFMSGGIWGACLMAFGAFLPSFSIVLFGNGYVKRIIKNKSVRPFLQGMVAGVIGLFAVTALEFAIAAITDWKRGMIAITVFGILYAVRSHFVIPLCIMGAGIIGIALI